MQPNRPFPSSVLISIAALSMAMPTFAQNATTAPAGNEDDIIQITPDNAQGNQPVHPSEGPPQLPPADGSSTVLPGPGSLSAAPSVLAILAHPDDELTIAPVLSRIEREGGKVTLVFATSGDAGPGLSELPPGQELASLREDEARCAAFGLGIGEPIFWRFGDGTLADAARNTDATASDFRKRIAQLIDLEEPDIVMSWGPDGGYGHADHRMVSNAVSQVVQGMGEDRPDLLYAAFPLPADDEANVTLPGFEGWARTHPSLITDRIRYEIQDLDAMQIATGCYVSQFDETARAFLTGMLHDRIWGGAIMFRQAFPGVR